jgi:hypothetical protein
MLQIGNDVGTFTIWTLNDREKSLKVTRAAISNLDIAIGECLLYLDGSRFILSS